MVRVFIFLFCFINLYGTNIDNKIKNTKTNLKHTKIEISNMNSQLDDIVKRISKETIYLNNINTQIKELNQKIKLLQNRLTQNKVSISKLIVKKNYLIQKKQKLQKEVINFIAKNYYIKSSDATSFQDVINEEILAVVAQKSAKKMDKLYKNYSNVDSEITKITNLIKEIQTSQAILKDRQLQISKLKQQRLQNLVKLQNMKQQYKLKLQKIIQAQTSLQNRLSNLKIIQKKELLAQRKKQKKLQQIKNQNKKLAKMDKTKIKNYGNIYMKTKTIRYRGKKTIPPLKGVITKKFGAYLDPVYNISLYNDSITIKPLKPNAKVRAIFSGRVVFVGDTNEGKMIVIKHRNRLHSIYAKLSRISPFIKKGYKVKKGEIIAKVKDELEFEITYKTLPINPIEVIKF